MNTKKRVTKSGQVLAHLIRHKSITSLQAIKLYNATRLSAIIFNLRNKDILIDSQEIHSKDCNGNFCPYVKYKLIRLNKNK